MQVLPCVRGYVLSYSAAASSLTQVHMDLRILLPVPGGGNVLVVLEKVDTGGGAAGILQNGGNFLDGIAAVQEQILHSVQKKLIDGLLEGQPVSLLHDPGKMLLIVSEMRGGFCTGQSGADIDADPFMDFTGQTAFNCAFMCRTDVEQNVLREDSERFLIPLGKIVVMDDLPEQGTAHKTGQIPA